MSHVFIFTLLSIIACTSQISESQSIDTEFLRKQELIFQLLWNTKDTPKNHPEVFERVKNYKIEDVAIACENQSYAKEFELHLKNAALSRNQVFSPFRDEHVDEVRIVFEVFRSAKHFDDFATMAAWSSLHVNELAWLHAFALAVAHRTDTKHLRLPNFYEIAPHYFFNTDVIVQAYRAKSGEVAGITEPYIIEANYSGQFPPQDQTDESRLDYFREDVGLNEFYFHFANSLPFWMSSQDNKARKNLRGELYYYVHKMILARYELERLSHGLGEIEDIDWDQPLVTGYYPSMTHFNGLQFPTRQAGAHVPVSKYKFVEEMKHFESRISKAIDLGELHSSSSRSKSIYEPTEVGSFNDLCNAMEGNTESPSSKLYGSLDRSYRRILGFAPETRSKRRAMPTSALETSLASLRDPGFYRMCKRIVEYGLRYKNNLPAYKRDELVFEGVRLDYIHLDQLLTYFSSFESTLNHPRVLHLNDETRQQLAYPTVKARQFRLDHKPFAYQIGVTSEKGTKAIVRLFLGPKFDLHGNELDLDESQHDFYELDRWIVDLKQGSNKLERHSSDSVYVIPDPTASDVYNRLISNALVRSSSADVDDVGRELVKRKLRRGLPRRLLLPRGTKAGLKLRLIVCLHPVEQSRFEEMDEGMVFGGMPLDGRSLGFPLDRRFDGVFEELRNVMVKEIKVFHEDAKDIKEDDR